MPWRTQDMDTLRREFATRALLKSASLAALCREYGISRKTGYKWRERAMADGLGALGELSRRPRASPKQLGESVVCALLNLKLAHPRWGPKKILELYARRGVEVPSLSSCQRVLGKLGQVERRRATRPEPERISRGLVAKAPNEVWTVDFKGWWLLANGQRCGPLTVRDSFSRYILGARCLPKADTDCVRREFERLFLLYGMPAAIKSDNGVPFACMHAPLGLSRLSAWWVALGIELDRSRPGHPQDNGAHERMHRDIEQEVASHVQSDLASQQAELDVWREEYNWVRPHEGLGQRRPGEVYSKSARRMATSFDLSYEKAMFPRRVSTAGIVRWHSTSIFVSSSLAGWHVGLRPASNDCLDVWFAHLQLGQIDLPCARFLRAPRGPQEASPRTSSA